MHLLPPRFHVPKQQSNAAFEDSAQPEDLLKRVPRLRRLMRSPSLAYLHNTRYPIRTHQDSLNQPTGCCCIFAFPID